MHTGCLSAASGCLVLLHKCIDYANKCNRPDAMAGFGPKGATGCQSPLLLACVVPSSVTTRLILSAWFEFRTMETQLIQANRSQNNNLHTFDSPLELQR